MNNRDNSNDKYVATTKCFETLMIQSMEIIFKQQICHHDSTFSNNLMIQSIKFISRQQGQFKIQIFHHG